MTDILPIANPGPLPTAIILAAGGATRMGQPKQLLDWGGVPLVRAVAIQALAAPVHAVLVVTGAAADAVGAALAGLPLMLVHNPDYASGQSSSVRAGINALPAEASGALVLLGDQPFVTAAVIGAIIAAWQAQRPMICAPVYGGTRGHPVLFSAALFPALGQLSGDQGARAILQRQAEQTLLVPFAQTEPLIDLDTPEEYVKYVRSSRLEGPAPQRNEE